MEKDEPEKSKLFLSQVALNNQEKEQKIKSTINPSIYKVKNKKPIDSLSQDNNSSKKELSQYLEGNKTIYEDNIENKNKKELNNSYEKNNKNNGINKKYNYYQDKEGNEDYDISENNTPQEKPEKKIFVKNNYTEKINNNIALSSELNKILQSTNKKEDVKFLKEENENENVEKNLDENNLKKIKEIDENEKLLENEYIPYKKYINKTKLFIILFSFGIILSLISSCICFFLELYSNQDVLIIIGALSFSSIIIYILWIIFILKDKAYVLLIINSKGNPEKINNSKYRKFILLILYLIITVLNYFIVFVLVNTIYLNNTKLSIRGKAYDINQWIELFSNQNYSEIIDSFEHNNLIFLIFAWLNYILMLVIFIYQFCLLMNYHLVKSTLQILCFLAIQGGIYQIYLSLHCYVFRDITSDEGIKISWVTPGTMATGAFAIILGIFGFYVFFIEHKKGIIIFQLGCVVQYILILIFVVGLGSIEDKFYSYKKAKCNSLFKFISEDYLLKNKFNGCNSKYLFTSDTLENMQCPKERIMINWERTENLYMSSKEKNNNNDDTGIINTGKKHIFFGCINQSCCLQIYFDIKNKFDLLLILGIHQLFFFVLVFFTCFYITCKIEGNLDEEIPEKINMLVMAIITLLSFIIILPFMSTLPKASNQSKLNLVENNPVSESLSIIQKDSTIINLDNLFKATNMSFNEVKGKNINDFKYNLIFDYLNDDNFEYILSDYEYIFNAQGLDVLITNNTLRKININDFENKLYDNSTEIIKFKTKSNIINKIFEYFNFVPRNPLKNNILLNIEINGIYSKKNVGVKEGEILESNNNDKNIIIYGSDIINNYNEGNNYNFVNIIKKEIDFSIMDKNEFFYIKGNIINDNGFSLINVYNYIYSNDTLYSTLSRKNGTFIIGPIYKLLKNNIPYHLSIEISKIKFQNNNEDEDLFDPNEQRFTYDNNYCRYYYFIKVDDYAFQTKDFYTIKNINLAEYQKGKMQLFGNVVKYDEEDDDDDYYLSYVNVRLYNGENINKIIEYIEINSNNLEQNYLDQLCLHLTSTNSEGEYNFNIYNTGQYLLLFIKDDYFIEKHLFNVDKIIEDASINIGSMQLIKFFNSGKVVLKLTWGLKPLDLDFVCRFPTYENYNCYTFFANKKCVETEFFIDNRIPEQLSSEIIEISELSEYIYLFYVRKYFDKSNGLTQNEFKIEGVENIKDMNHTETYILYDEYLNNTSAYIYIYSNGFKIPPIKIPIPDYDSNNILYNNTNNEYIYWAAFCIDGKKGINSIKIINQFMVDEPEQNICLSYYKE